MNVESVEEGGCSLPQHVHLLGAGGSGISGLGRLLLARGHRVTGQDRSRSVFFDGLLEAGAELVEGDSSAGRLPAGAGLLVRSAAVPEDDPQVVRARGSGLEVLKYAEALARLAPSGRSLAVAGTHGKTTTTWLLYHALESLARLSPGRPHSPGALVGGRCTLLNTNAVAPEEGGWFALEACEYDRSFLAFEPQGAIITGVEPDHLDCYGDFAGVLDAFADFAARVRPDGLLVLGAEVPAEVERACPARVWRMGRELELELLAERAGRFRFALSCEGLRLPALELALPGRFNVENAALALALATGAELAGLSGSGALSEVALRALTEGVAGFAGVSRRFEPWGSAGGVQVVHDYAHHPTAVRCVLEATRRVFPGSALHVLFQPHQESRTADFLVEFAESLRGADHVVVADVYGARAPQGRDRRASASDLVTELRARRGSGQEGGGLENSVKVFVESLPAGGVALVLGAGDIDEVKHALMQELALRGARQRTPGV